MTVSSVRPDICHLKTIVFKCPVLSGLVFCPQDGRPRPEPVLGHEESLKDRTDTRKNWKIGLFQSLTSLDQNFKKQVKTEINCSFVIKQYCSLTLYVNHMLLIIKIG